MNFELLLSKEYYFAILETYYKIKNSQYLPKVVGNTNTHVGF